MTSSLKVGIIKSMKKCQRALLLAELPGRRKRVLIAFLSRRAERSGEELGEGDNFQKNSCLQTATKQWL